MHARSLALRWLLGAARRKRGAAAGGWRAGGPNATRGEKARRASSAHPIDRLDFEWRFAPHLCCCGLPSNAAQIDFDRGGRVSEHQERPTRYCCARRIDYRLLAPAPPPIAIGIAEIGFFAASRVVPPSTSASAAASHVPARWTDRTRARCGVTADLGYWVRSIQDGLARAECGRREGGGGSRPFNPRQTSSESAVALACACWLVAPARGFDFEGRFS